MNNNPNRRQEISDFAKKLIELSKLAPDGYAKRDLTRTIHGLRQRYSLSPENKRQMILKLLESGLTTYAELLAETRFGKKQLSREIETLISDKKIRVEKVSRTGGAGRPALCYFPQDN